ncbi:putative oxidoreductase [Dickeya dianthicola]|uniref:SDR family NAD(P)-dependent oxidoreductase n=1 Tax=Dickeya dianthicola TaxID=204039 RepID=UPI0003A20935|nr:SDR family NAD(P)-dependent oxidoreductase [Dickeya dianthicola]AYC20293.1 putative oxidoreductase [Dickeya dianthicola]MCI4004230.1 SDR family NAD(P)-dependent oxidoreductase [Dickeya dianthicola]MCI4028974.1 SDR family NAD(P)-dependent oxidoreductase [Dickeya dianthicola]MCI4070979.1 SDR family NAD(P)-dependent oxidoreductase [Dickeya dianthicola]MCI4115952.1 SDR family NAD(P)-dependent oxidoreductase [Dickeya dianthicola]
MPVLSDKVAIITGASSGIGYATAKRFALEGASVVLGARRRQKLDTLVEEITLASGHAVALASDVKSETFAKARVELAMDRFGGLDIAFNNAGTTGATGSTLLADGGASICRT